MSDLVTLPVTQRQVDELLEQISPGLAARVKAAAMPSWLQIIKVERLREAELPLIAAVARAQIAIGRAQFEVQRAQSEARSFKHSPLHSWLSLAERGLALANPSDCVDDYLTGAERLADLRSTHVSKKRVRPAPSDRTMSTRVMPRVRVAIYRQIAPAVRAHFENAFTPIVWNGKTLREDEAAYALTAAYIQAFFPAWGASTSSRSVQTAVRNNAQRQSGRRPTSPR